MQISELEEILKKENLLNVHIDGCVKQYVKEDDYDKEWNKVDVYGIFREENGTYCVFITDSERGIADFSDIYDTEDEACESLLKIIRREDRIYKKSLEWYTEKNKK